MSGRSLLVGVLLTAACAYPHEMERAVPPPAGGCPAPTATTGARAAGAEPGGMLWYRAAEERDRTLAGRWCATVGDPVVQLSPWRTSEWRPGDPLEVISWNMWIGGGDLYRLLREEVGVDCSGDPGGSGSVDPFVLLLQEVWRHDPDLPEVEPSRIIPFTIDPAHPSGPRSDIVEVAQRCGLALVYVPSARNGPDSGTRPGEDKGNAILSNVQLRTPISFDLPLEGGRKVAVAASVVDPGGRRVRLVSMHLDVASTLVRSVFSGNQTRVRQAMGLVDGLEKAESEGYAVDATVVGADMNTWAGNEAALKRMRLAFPQSPEWDGLATRGLVPTDHMFFRTTDEETLAVASYQRMDRYSSDHHPRRLFVISRVASQ